MKSITKTHLTKETIKCLCVQCFGEAVNIHEITELNEGMFNSAYKISYDDQKETMLKISVSPDTKVLTYEKDMMRTELYVYDLLADSKIPAPNVIYRDLSREIIPNDYFFMTVLKGKTLQSLQKKLTKDEIIGIEEQLVEYMAIMHQHKGSYFGYMTRDVNKQFKTWDQAVKHMFDMILKDAKAQHMKLPYESITRVIDKHQSLLKEIKEPRLIDFDMWAGNIFISNINHLYKITGIVDFERSFYGDPMAEFAGHNFFITDIRQKKHMLDCYHQHTNHVFSDHDFTRYQIYRLYLMVIMYTETYRYKKMHRFIQKVLSKMMIKRCISVLEKALKE